MLDRIKREPAFLGGVLAAVADALISSPDWNTALFVVLGLIIRSRVTPVQ